MRKLFNLTMDLKEKKKIDVPEFISYINKQYNNIKLKNKDIADELKTATSYREEKEASLIMQKEKRIPSYYLIIMPLLEVN